MKRFITILFLFTMLFSGTVSEGFIQNRYQWWKIRRHRLQEERDRLVKSKLYDRRVIDLVEAEIDDAVDILSVYERKLSGDGSLTHVRKEFTPEEIRDEAAAVVPMVFALHYLETLVNDAGSQESFDAAKKAVAVVLDEKLGEEFSSGSRELAAMILREDISENEWKNLSVEYFIGRMMEKRFDLEKAIAAAVTDSVREQLLHIDNRATAIELREMIVRSAAAEMKNVNINRPGVNRKALGKAWTWRMIDSRVGRHCSIYSDIISMVKFSGDLPFDRIRHLHKNPTELESLVFTGSLERHLFPGRVEPDKSESKERNAVTLVIPVLPGNRYPLMEMEDLRKRAVEYISGNEKQEYFTELEKQFNLIIGKRMNRTNNIFNHEEERVRILKEKNEGKDVLVTNLESFEKAKKVFRNRLHLLYHYKKSSLEFIHWVYKSKEKKSSDIVSRYESQVSRSGEYVNFAAGLVRAASLSPATDNDTCKRLMVSVQRVENIFRGIEYPLSIDREYYAYLTVNDAQRIKTMKGSLLNEINLARFDVKKYYTAFLRRKAAAERKEKEVLENLEGRIAQHEVDLMMKNALRYGRACEKMNYLEEAFTGFVLKYREIESNARMDRMTADLKTVLRQRSIIPVVTGFSDRKLAGEIRTAAYLKTGARAALARLGAILQYYRRSRVEIEGPPGADEINAVYAMIEKNVVVTVGDWRMHEQNYREVDRKLVQKLADIVRRNIWSSNSTVTEKPPDTTVSVRLITGECSLSIPRGWSESETSAGEKSRGIVKTFTSIDSEAFILVAELPVKRLTPKEVTERWLTDSGETLVTKEWTRMGKHQFLRVLSKEGNDTITETYSLERNGLVILVSGRTTRNRYMLFKPKLDSVMESLKL